MDRNIAPGTVPLAQGAVAPAGGGTPGLFVDPDPALGIAPTECPPWLLNMLIEEIRNAVVRGGLTPSATYWAQLADAIVAIAQSVTGSAGPYVRQGAGVGQAANVVNIGRSTLAGDKLKATIDGATDFGNFAFEGWANGTFVPLTNGFRNIYVYNANATFVVPTGVTAVRFGVVGGGGGGGACAAGQWTGGGGGAGGGVIGCASVTPGQVISLVVGAGGAPAGLGSHGGDGGSSYFGSYGSATGGHGGGSNSPFCEGGRGGTGALGLTSILGGYAFSGGDGTDGLAPGAVAALGGQCFMAGDGGGSLCGGGARGGNGGGLAGQGYGSGGGGAYGITSGGGQGGGGLVWVEA